MFNGLSRADAPARKRPRAAVTEVKRIVNLVLYWDVDGENSNWKRRLSVNVDSWSFLPHMWQSFLTWREDPLLAWTLILEAQAKVALHLTSTSTSPNLTCQILYSIAYQEHRS